MQQADLSPSSVFYSSSKENVLQVSRKSFLGLDRSTSPLGRHCVRHSLAGRRRKGGIILLRRGPQPPKPAVWQALDSAHGAQAPSTQIPLNDRPLAADGGIRPEQERAEDGINWSRFLTPSAAAKAMARPETGRPSTGSG
jgi:hypothetical protein